MKIEAFIIMYNEREILPMVIRHYQKFCGKITFFDNFSTDDSQLIAESMGCDVKKFGKKGELSDQAYLDVKNQCWKNSDADWVIVCDCDEVLFINENMNQRLARIRFEEKTIIKTQGWQIYSNEMPKEDLLEITTGYKFDNYSKSIIFNPKAIKEINYKPGCHICHPFGDVVYSDETFYILHYRTIGGVDRQIKRYKEYCRRMSIQNRRMGWGSHYWDKETILRKEWKERLAKSKPLL